MDPSMFMSVSPTNGLPQESKLATYMSHGTSTPTRILTQSIGKLNLRSSPIMNKKENLSGTTYFYAGADNINSSGNMNNSSGVTLDSSTGIVECSTPNFGPQIYQGNQTHVAAKSVIDPAMFLPETIRAEILQRNNAIMPTDSHNYSDVPETVETYAELVPLESRLHGVVTTSYRATSRLSGEYFAMRRLHGFGRSGTTKTPIEAWKKLDHPNIVRLRDVFTTKAFGDHSMVYVYDYHPGSTTLMSAYISRSHNGSTLSSSPGLEEHNSSQYTDPFSNDPDVPRPYSHQKNVILRAVAAGNMLPEAFLWSLLIQLTGALRTIHANGLACRTLDPTKVIVSGWRIRISWCGISESCSNNSSSTSPTNCADVIQAQQDDLSALGQLALTLACRSVHASSRDNLQASMELISRTYSADFKNLILYLLSCSSGRRSVTDLMPMIGARFYTQVESLQRRSDTLEDQFARELDNGRLYRLLVKLATINERPELNLDSSWSETGDRYMLKLFRDYLFHSVTADGRPWLDYSHLSYCLNQLDSGTQNKVQLISRDEQSILVVSYAELKHCLDQAFDEIMQATVVPPS